MSTEDSVLPAHQTSFTSQVNRSRFDSNSPSLTSLSAFRGNALGTGLGREFPVHSDRLLSGRNPRRFRPALDRVHDHLVVAELVEFQWRSILASLQLGIPPFHHLIIVLTQLITPIQCTCPVRVLAHTRSSQAGPTELVLAASILVLKHRTHDLVYPTRRIAVQLTGRTAMSARIEEVSSHVFDYIVVGGGTAGLTAAAKISEDPTLSVLVLEAGPANIDEPEILRPASFGNHFGNESFAWNHTTVPQNTLGGRQVFWPRGKGLGGSSAVNFLCWSKPPAKDIDDIERLGNPGWNWKNYIRRVREVEGFAEPPQAYQEEYSLSEASKWKLGTKGPLKVSYPATVGNGQKAVRDAILNTNIPVARDPHGGDPDGFQWMTQSLDPVKHTRTYSTTAFYIPNKDRPNLKVLTSALVRRVLTERLPSGEMKVTGVEFFHGEHVHFSYAHKEVLLCAGCLKTPQLLELSGIGRRDVLEKANIPIHLELPGVGENIQEHIFVGVVYELKPDVDWYTIDIHRDEELLAKHIELHELGKGLFTTGISGFTFVTLDKIAGPNRTGEIHRDAAAVVAAQEEEGAPASLIEQLKIQLARLEPGSLTASPGNEIINFPGYIPGGGPNPPEPGKKYVSILLALNHCFSRGTIHVSNKDPNEDPEFDPHYFEQNVDLEVLLELVKYGRRLANVAPFKDIIVKELNPGPEVTTDDELRDWIKAYFGTTFHTVGACSMLPKEKGGVVDPSLKVYGTTNLRVADISVVPLHFGAHSLSTAYAIGAIAADLVKGKGLND